VKLDKLTQPGSEDAADYFCETKKKFGTSKLRVPAIVQPQTYDVAVAPAPTTFGHFIESLEIPPGIPKMPQGTSRPGSRHIRLGWVKLQLNMSLFCVEPTTESDTSPLQNAKPVQSVSFYPCI